MNKNDVICSIATRFKAATAAGALSGAVVSRVALMAATRTSMNVAAIAATLTLASTTLIGAASITIGVAHASSLIETSAAGQVAAAGQRSTLNPVATAAEPTTQLVQHNAGQTEVSSPPATTAVLDLALLDVFHSLGIPVAAVPTGRYDGALAVFANDSVLKVGSMFEPDLDALRALNPDLIVAGRRSTKAFDSVAQVAPAVNLAFDQQNLVESVVQTTRTVAQLYGKQALADEKITTLKESVERLRQTASGAGTGLLVFTTSGKVIAQSPASRFGVLFNDFGVQSAITEFPEGRGVALTPELLQSAQPDWLYVLDRDASLGRDETPAQELLAQIGADQTPAGKNGRIVYLNPYNWYLLDAAGLGALQDNVNQLLEALENAS